MCTLYWFCGVFIYGSVASSHRGFNASLGNAYMLNNVDFDGPPMVYTTGLITIRGIIYYIDCLSCICQWRGGADEDVWSVHLKKGFVSPITSHYGLKNRFEIFWFTKLDRSRGVKTSIEILHLFSIDASIKLVLKLVLMFTFFAFFTCFLVQSSCLQ